MSWKSAVVHWTLSIPTLFSAVVNSYQCFFLNVHFYILVFLRLCPNQQTWRYWLCVEAQFYMQIYTMTSTGAAWSGCDTSLWRSPSCRLVSVRVEKKFSSVLQRFNWSQSECGTLSQYVGHETRDGDAVQSHKKSWTVDFWIFSRKNEFIIPPIVAITEQKNILWFANIG